MLGRTDKIVVDRKGGEGVLPFKPLDQLTKHSRGQMIASSLDRMSGWLGHTLSR
jgi:hypothetical protein